MSTVFISEFASPELADYIRRSGYKVCKVLHTDAVYSAVAAHPDIYMCKLGNDIVSSPQLVLSAMPDFPPISCNHKIGFEYPQNIAYNAVQVGNHFIHNLRYTAPELKKRAIDMGLIPVNVAQGYTKCSIAVIDDNSIITSDTGIAKILTSAPIDVLLISLGNIKLHGFETGFIGGCTGRIGDEIIFNGKISDHPDYSRIVDFIHSRNLTFKEFDYPLTDIGSIIVHH